MKRRVSILLVLCLIAACFSTAFAASFDMSPIRSSEYASIDVNSEDGLAFIQTTFSSKDCSFTHSEESQYGYSCAYFDILVIDYFKTNSQPVYRLWLELSTDEGYAYVNSVTFTLNGKNYTFSGISDTDWFYKREKYYTQKMLIKFGLENLDFLVALETYFNSFDTLEAVVDGFAVPVVFHGTRDITATLDYRFGLEFLVTKKWVIDSNALEFFSKTNNTDMKVTNVN